MSSKSRYRWLPQPLRRVGRRWLIMRRQVPNVRRYHSLRTTPVLSARHILFNRELVNFTYEIENVDELVQMITRLLAEEPERVASFAKEIQENDALRDELRVKLRHRPDRNLTMPFGRRVGWYILARLLKPRLVIETGTHDGLGSVAILQALELNAADGLAGRLISIDIDPTTGWLVPDRLRGRYEQLHGDSLDVLGRLSGRVDLAILDSAHVYEHEAEELALLGARAGEAMVLVSDNPGTNSLADFAAANKLLYDVFRERPRGHIHPGAGLGLAVPIAEQRR
jgi:predicted O-methyltransferase YrrM